MHYDNLSISSYGSHKNRNFNVGSHKGSLHSFHGSSDQQLLAGNQRTVVIDDNNIDARSISEVGDFVSSHISHYFYFPH